MIRFILSYWMDSCELELEIAVGAAKQCGLKVLATPDGEGETLLYCRCKSCLGNGWLGREVIADTVWGRPRLGQALL